MNRSMALFYLLKMIVYRRSRPSASGLDPEAVHRTPNGYGLRTHLISRLIQRTGWFVS